MTYAQANELLTGRNYQRRKLANNTYLIRVTQVDRPDDLNSPEARTYFDQSHFAIELHGNAIIKLYPDHFKVTACGWYTNTTKDRLNHFAPLNGYIFQSKYEWYIAENNDREGAKLFNSIENTALNY